MKESFCQSTGKRTNYSLTSLSHLVICVKQKQGYYGFKLTFCFQDTVVLMHLHERTVSQRSGTENKYYRTSGWGKILRNVALGIFQTGSVSRKSSAQEYKHLHVRTESSLLKAPSVLVLLELSGKSLNFSEKRFYMVSPQLFPLKEYIPCVFIFVSGF